MGIPFYFAKVLRNKRGVVVAHRKPDEPCAGLVIDFNAIVHQALASLCDARTQQTAATRPEGVEGVEGVERTLFEAVARETALLVSACGNPATVHMMIDGLPPLAKTMQQRRRRFAKVAESPPTPDAFDSNAITCGTSFMDRLEAFLVQRFPQYHLSGHRESGEGEHKIRGAVRDMSRDLSIAGDIVVAGADADLIMLMMLTLYGMYGMYGTSCTRGATCEQKKKKPVRIFRWNGSAEAHRAETISVDAVLKHISIVPADYVVLVALLGNDFLPPLSHMSVKSGSMDDVIRAYHTVGRPLVRTAARTINADVLACILRILQAKEREELGRDKQALDTSDGHNLWRPVYYERYVRQGTYSEIVRASVDTYVAGLRWFTRYYLSESREEAEAARADQWYYPFPYSPLISDVIPALLAAPPPDDAEAMRLVDANSDSQDKSQDAPDTALDHALLLATVIPPASWRVVQDVEFVRDLWTHPDTAHMYPTRFRTMGFLKHKDWEHVTLLPDANQALLRRTLAKLQQSAVGATKATLTRTNAKVQHSAVGATQASSTRTSVTLQSPAAASRRTPPSRPPRCPRTSTSARKSTQTPAP